MTEQILRWFSSIESATSLLSAAYLIAALLVALAIAAYPSPRGHAIKLLGSIVVVGLSLAANSPFVYAIGVFVVATLVTDLEFLEKLAAIVWNRKEYWQYLIDRATPKEIEEKRAEDAEEIGEEQKAISQSTEEKRTEETKEPGPTSESQNASSEDAPAAGTNHPGQYALSNSFDRIDFLRRFEESAIQALRRLKPFQFAEINTSVRVQTIKSGPYKSTIIDAVIRYDNTHIIIEIKAYRNRSNLSRAIEQLLSIVAIYRAARGERGENPTLIPVLVVPSTTSVPFEIDGVLILRFDFDSKKFINADNLTTYLDFV